MAGGQILELVLQSSGLLRLSLQLLLGFLVQGCHLLLKSSGLHLLVAQFGFQIFDSGSVCSYSTIVTLLCLVKFVFEGLNLLVLGCLQALCLLLALSLDILKFLLLPCELVLQALDFLLVCL